MADHYFFLFSFTIYARISEQERQSGVAFIGASSFVEQTTQCAQAHECARCAHLFNRQFPRTYELDSLRTLAVPAAASREAGYLEWEIKSFFLASLLLPR